ncbi:Growth_factor receptor cysteine-rich domain superfamily [Hexamita inflata]|uniref:Growth factor receptor cysteine-rich domain superfamily n=1 Tax=Hexamita inflata TaxID=28002 RepID=A0AA86U4Y8_9EUKA|nr:Growth factor receptor cysteine-rich domain superfamily [Hexamita inflata]
MILNQCQTDSCCQIIDFNTHLVHGECQTCSEVYDYDNQVCATCKDLYGEYSYYMNESCHCGGGSVGTNTICENCWLKQLVVNDNMCIQCSQFDKNALYLFENSCTCTSPYIFYNFRCKYFISAEVRMIIVSSVLSFALLVLIALIILYFIFKRKTLNSIEFRTKINKNNFIEQKLNLIQIEPFGGISTANTTKNELVILDEIDNMNQIIKEIEIQRIDEIKENEVYLYRE